MEQRRNWHSAIALVARGRAKWFFPLAVVATLLLGLVSSSFGIASAQDTGTPSPQVPDVDLPAMILTPIDLADLGLTGFGVQSSTFVPLRNVVNGTARRTGAEAEAVRSTLESAGWQRQYRLLLATPRDAAADPPGVASRIVINLVHFADADGAAAGFTFLEDESANLAGEGTPTPQDVAGTHTVGDQSEITSTIRGGGDDRSEGGPSLSLSFRRGEMVASVALVNVNGAAPEVAQIEAIADRLLANLDAVRDQDVTGPSVRVLHLGGRGVNNNEDQYVRLGGDNIIGFNQNPEQAGSRFDRFGDAADVYSVSQRIAAGADDRNDDYVYAVTVSRFVSPAAASAWLKASQPNLGQNLEDVAVVSDAPVIGEESVAYTFSSVRRQVPIRGRVIVVRVGPEVAVVRLEGFPEPPAAAIQDLAQAQAKCLTDGVCIARADVPASLAEVIGGAPDASPAAATPADPTAP